MFDSFIQYPKLISLHFKTAPWVQQKSLPLLSFPSSFITSHICGIAPFVTNCDYAKAFTSDLSLARRANLSIRMGKARFGCEVWHTSSMHRMALLVYFPGRIWSFFHQLGLPWNKGGLRGGDILTYSTPGAEWMAQLPLQNSDRYSAMYHRTECGWAIYSTLSVPNLSRYHAKFKKMQNEAE